jgi:Uma2 family endonuclease
MSAATTQKEIARESAPSSSSGIRPYPITVEVYERIVASGVFGDKSSIFLWKGQLVEQIPDTSKGRPHVYAVNKLGRLLSGLVPGDRFVEQDQPMEVGDDSSPEPDLKVVRGRGEDYLDRTPTSRDVPLVIEVSASNLEDDSGEMFLAYAEAVIPVYWIVNLPRRRVEVYTEPTGPNRAPSYGASRHYGPDDEVPVILDGREVGKIAVRDVLP